MAGTRKVFFGSLFEFTDLGAKEVLESLSEHYADPGDAPFVSYDKNTKLFSCEVEINDHHLVPTINAQIGTYTTMHGDELKDLFESDRLLPIDGTVIRNEAWNNNPREHEHNTLFELSSSSDEGDGSNEDLNTMYWKPTKDDITIIDPDILAEIADATGTFFIPEVASQRVQLAHGNLELAFGRLQRLEKVLDILKRTQRNTVICSDSNISLLQSGPETTIRFTRPVHPLCGFDRILLHPVHASIFNQIVLGEVRIWQDFRRVKPLNLDLENIPLTPHVRSSTLFNGLPLPNVGIAKNAMPRPPSKENSQLSGGLPRPGSPTKFLGQKETERVEEWRGNIDPDAVPTLAPTIPAPDDEKKQTSRRRVAYEDSDDESDDQMPIRVGADSKVDAPEKNDKWNVALQEDIATSTLSKPTTLSRAERDTTEDQNVSVKRSSTIQSSISKPQPTSSNKFELLGYDDAMDQQHLEPKLSSPHLIKSTSKRLNVSFEQLDSAVRTHNPRISPSSLANFGQLDRPEFDPSKYGAKKRSRNAQNEVVESHHDEAAVAQLSSPDPVQTTVIPRSGSQNVRSSPHDKRNRHKSNIHGAGNTGQWFDHRKDLIDTSPDNSSGWQTKPPPGFEYRSETANNSLDLLTSSYQDASYSPILYPSPAHDATTSTPSSESGSKTYLPSHMNFTPQFIKPKTKVNVLKNRSIALLEAQMKAKSEETTENSGKENKTSPNRIKQNDERSTRKYHNTMSQKMAKPGKGKQNNKNQETKAEREARIAKAKAEAYGDDPFIEASQPKPRPPPRMEDMTAKKRQLLKKNQAMAEMHQDVMADSVNRQAGQNLLEELKSILEAARAFKGVIGLEVQLGQALILKNNRVDEGRFYKSKEWLQLLNGSSNTGVQVTFTNILTTNGADIDRMFDIQTETGGTTLWSNSYPGIVSTEFEFTCQDKAGRDFNLILDQHGDHRLTNLKSTIGQVTLHAPSQIWDACVIVSGTMPLLRPSDELLAGVAQFRESLYVPGGKKAAVYYRLPPNNAFTIRAIVMRRASLHDCSMLAQENIQMRITEIKSLAHSSHPTDKKLYRSYESNYDVMVREGRMHYEVAIIDRAIEKAYSSNPDIEIGELAPINTSDGKVLSAVQARSLIDITSYMLSSIDWAGSSNHGTLRRIFENAADQRLSIVNALPPGGLNSNVAIPMGTNAPPTIVPANANHSQVLSRLEGTAVTTTISSAEPVLVRQLHGVRANTTAELYQDRATGDLFYYGQGGARIPVANNDINETGGRFDGLMSVFPGDSASQAGDIRARMTNTNTAKGGAWDDKPAGFW